MGVGAQCREREMSFDDVNVEVVYDLRMEDKESIIRSRRRWVFVKRLIVKPPRSVRSLEKPEISPILVNIQYFFQKFTFV